MIFSRSKIVLGIVLGAALIFVLAYIFIFHTAILQRENHVGILLAMPRVLSGAGAVRVDEYTYIATSTGSFEREMERQGFDVDEQMGAVLNFHKDGVRYFSVSRMYSSNYILFSYPARSE